MVDLTLPLFAGLKQASVRRCTKCLKEKPHSSFYAVSGGRFSGRCRECYGRKDRVCQECHSPFFGWRHAKFCSAACRWTSERRQKLPRRRNDWSRQRICVGCGKEESVRKDNIATRCKSCSAVIGQIAGLKVIQANRVTAQCSNCKTEFFTNRSSNARAQANRYCSHKCRSLHGSVPRECKQCGAGFRVAKSRMGGNNNTSGNFCCRPCYVEWLCQPDRPQPRGSQWKSISVECISRAPFCAKCGRSDGLQVHHIIPYRLTKDNAQDNLVPLCRAHHGQTERAFRKIERTFTGNLADLKSRLRAEFDAMQSITRKRLESDNAPFGSLDQTESTLACR